MQPGFIETKRGKKFIITLFEGGQLMTKWHCLDADCQAVRLTHESLTPSRYATESCGGNNHNLTYLALKAGETSLKFQCQSQNYGAIIAEKLYKITIK
jgi:hypothetical protein